jgi:O-methyltransferase
MPKVPLGEPVPTIHLRGDPGQGYREPWPAYPPPGYLGQLNPDYQSRLAASRAWITREDCDFYHSATLPSGDEIKGAWDLRGREPDYLGNVDFIGRRVLEIGPASGHMSRYMESVGANVVSVDAGFDRSIELMPRPGSDPEAERMEMMLHIGKEQNAWWYLAREFGSKVTMVYGDVYALPGDLGTFDVGVLASIMLHLRSPIDVLRQAAARTAHEIVVTEPLQDTSLDPDVPLMRFAPFGLENRVVWWLFTPATIVDMVRAVGFTKTRIHYHSQLHHIGHDLTKPAQEIPMFTVVGERE